MTQGQKDLFKTFPDSQENKKISEADHKPVWFHDLYGTNDLYLMRKIRNFSTDEIIGTLVIEVKKYLLLKDLKMSDFNNMDQASLLDLSGQVIMDYKNDEDKTSIDFNNELIQKMEQFNIVNK